MAWRHETSWLGWELRDHSPVQQTVDLALMLVLCQVCTSTRKDWTWKVDEDHPQKCLPLREGDGSLTSDTFGLLSNSISRPAMASKPPMRKVPKKLSERHNASS